MGLAPSIDTFLETHRDNNEFVLLGKLGIARSIATAERNSLMSPAEEHSTTFDLASLSQTWYPSLAQQMFTGVPANCPANAFANVSFIVFNYDRCLQHYLTTATSAYFRISHQEAAEIVGQATFVHPYGSIGNAFPSTDNHMRFAPNGVDLFRASQQIRTYSESSKLAATIHQMVYSAETLVFLGFAFHDANMELLDPDSPIFYDTDFRKRIFATTLGLSKSDERVVRDQLSKMITGEPESREFGEWIQTNKGTCRELFNSFWRSLTA